MNKEAARQYNEMAGRSMLVGAIQALNDTGHTKAASQPEKVLKAMLGQMKLEKEAQESFKPIKDQADEIGLDTLGTFVD